MTKSLLTPAKISEGFVPTVDLDISKAGTKAIFIDIHGNISCYLGYIRANREPFSDYLSVCASLNHPKGKNPEFLKVVGGAIIESHFNPGKPYCRIAEEYYVSLGDHSRLYGIFDRRHNLHEDHTRAIFGATENDLYILVEAFAKLTGRRQPPRVTRSRTQSYECNFSSGVIPKNFPYIAFEESNYLYGRISICSFFRIFKFLCASKNSSIREFLLRENVPEEVIEFVLARDATLQSMSFDLYNNYHTHRC